MTGLQQLALREEVCYHAHYDLCSIQQLPLSITALKLSFASERFATAMLNGWGAPGITQLTALKSLEIEPLATHVDTDMLTTLVCLERLVLDARLMGWMSQLAALTNLKHLRLPPRMPGAILLLLSNTDYGAVTASTQLTYLSMQHTINDPYACTHLFSEARQLLQLSEFQASLDLVCDADTAGKLVACCPNLQDILLCPQQAPRELEEAGDMLQKLQPLQQLTSLAMHTAEAGFSIDMWHALGDFTQLRNLAVTFKDMEGDGQLAGVLQLSRCCRLTQLHVEAQHHWEGHGSIFLSGKEEVRCCMRLGTRHTAHMVAWSCRQQPALKHCNKHNIMLCRQALCASCIHNARLSGSCRLSSQVTLPI